MNNIYTEYVFKQLRYEQNSKKSLKILKGVVRSSKAKNRQSDWQNKRTTYGLQNTIQKTKDRATRTTKHHGFSGRVIRRTDKAIAKRTRGSQEPV